MTASLETTEPLSTRRQLELMRDLQRLANERSAEESRIRSALADGLRAAEQARDRAAAEIERQFAEGRAQATDTYEQSTTNARAEYEQQRDAAQRQYKGLRSGVESEAHRVIEEAHSEQQVASWEALTVFDALKGRPRERYLATVRQLARANQEVAVLEHDAVTIMQMRRQPHDLSPVALPDEVAVSGATADGKEAQRVVLGKPTGYGQAESKAGGQVAKADPVDVAIEHVEAQITAMRAAAVALERQKLSRWFAGGAPFGLFLLTWLLAALPCAWLLVWQNWQWVAASAALAATATLGLLVWLWPIARRQSGQQFQEVMQHMAQTRQAIELAVAAARERGQREAHALAADRDQQLAAVSQKLESVVGEREQWRDSQIGQAGQTFPSRLAELRAELEKCLARASREHAASLAQLTEDRDRRVTDNSAEYARQSQQLRADHERDAQALAQRWHDGLAEIRAAWDQMDARCAELFPDWETTDYAAWTTPFEPAPAIRFGEVTLDLSQVKNGMPQDARLQPAQTEMRVPALLTLDETPVFLVAADEEGRRPAVELLQLVILRMLTAMPPGKVRFTILDPVGLGENFASFMHLADFDELLIASRIWTDARQIEEQLTRLTAHMETVLQKYLRNEFATIHEYNAQAGEVAEPFQVLVVANFPTNFSEAAARKLVSIATSGPRCGIYTLLSMDRKQRMPANFDLHDLTAAAVHLDWVPSARTGRPGAPQQSAQDTGQFRWRYPAFERLPLALDRPPSAERFNEVVRAAGRAAKDSMKVEVPFEQVAPDEREYWTGDCGQELVVPIGRAGARRLQCVRLGKGTSQHLLVCGKTGSGKSTFLHALITNAALRYSPDEVEFYLIDFKKGVEFKTYASHRLPHARVIAIESEREFGLSVLERLDEELRRRGDLFRAAGVQDVPDFRRARPTEPMPRVLLVVDEFQELFVEDDKLAQDAALLLDRLVRQGRAFGIHVLLGSQTLSGAYSLARSTMGQMAVRVALQCSEADAHLILNDERNEAARFLSRPGEAIYNDQNGLLAGNHPFQVVWLSESQRVEYLRRVEGRGARGELEEPSARSSPLAPRSSLLAPQIVFEGDQPADPANNAQLRELLVRGPSGAAGAPQRAWLGAAVAIKEPTAATFGRHAGSNLLVVGAWEESALGVLTNAVLALALQNGGRSEERGAKSEEQGAESEEQRASDEQADSSRSSQLDPRSSPLAPHCYILDGTRPESPLAGTWQQLAQEIGRGIQVGGPRDTARVIGHLAAELARREAAGQDDAPPIYLVIFNGGRFRDLRRGEDDFSFSSSRDKPPSPDKQWAEILANGPAWGIHSLVWCDSYNNVTRLLDRMALREFEMRVAFQMSAADSSSLLDSPAAARLRQHRGLFASEDLGTLEKFRPYGIPTAAWLEEVRRVIRAR